MSYKKTIDQKKKAWKKDRQRKKTVALMAAAAKKRTIQERLQSVAIGPGDGTYALEKLAEKLQRSGKVKYEGKKVMTE